jgi:hypothetical protein
MAVPSPVFHTPTTASGLAGGVVNDENINTRKNNANAVKIELVRIPDLC